MAIMGLPFEYSIIEALPTAVDFPGLKGKELEAMLFVTGFTSPLIEVAQTLARNFGNISAARAYQIEGHHVFCRPQIGEHLDVLESYSRKHDIDPLQVLHDFMGYDDESALSPPAPLPPVRYITTSTLGIVTPADLLKIAFKNISRQSRINAIQSRENNNPPSN